MYSMTAPCLGWRIVDDLAAAGSFPPAAGLTQPGDRIDNRSSEIFRSAGRGAPGRGVDTAARRPAGRRRPRETAAHATPAAPARPATHRSTSQQYTPFRQGRTAAGRAPRRTVPTVGTYPGPTAEDRSGRTGP